MKTIEITLLLATTFFVGFVARAEKENATGKLVKSEGKRSEQKTEAKHRLGDVTVKGRTQAPRLQTTPEIEVARNELPVELPKDFNESLATQIDAITAE